MDAPRFDLLSRRMAGIGSRRRALKAIAAAIAAAIAGGRVSAQSCVSQYQGCQNDGECCSGAVCQYGICMPGCRIGGVFVNGWTPQAGNPCARCAPEISITSWSPANEGMGCWSGNLCGGATTCQSGSCQPVSSTACRPLTVCHEAGVCDPGTGLCTNPPAEAGKVCSGSGQCFGGFYSPPLRCDGMGACVGGPVVPCYPYLCGDSACTTSCESDDDCATHAHCDDGGCFPDRELGEGCDEDSDCQSGFCTNGVCCDRRCDGNCELCTVESSGRCSPVVCSPLDQCHLAGVCDEETGSCSQPTKLNGAACDNGNACTVNDACQDGVCVPGEPVTCDPAPDACHNPGVCDTATGICSPPQPTVNFLTDDRNCGSCGIDCQNVLMGSSCVGGQCRCEPAYEPCGRFCTSLCSRDPARYRGRFQDEYGRTGSCAEATGWMGCIGELDTETACGTVVNTC